MAVPHHVSESWLLSVHFHDDTSFTLSYPSVWLPVHSLQIIWHFWRNRQNFAGIVRSAALYFERNWPLVLYTGNIIGQLCAHRCPGTKWCQAISRQSADNNISYVFFQCSHAIEAHVWCLIYWIISNGQQNLSKSCRMSTVDISICSRLTLQALVWYVSITSMIITFVLSWGNLFSFKNKNTLETCKNPRPTSGWSELTKSCTT